MSNLSGYSDYDGPTHWRSSTTASESAGPPTSAAGAVEERRRRTAPLLLGTGDDDASSSAGHLDLEETNPLQVGFWREGDSLAPPCGCTMSTIHALLAFAGVSQHDVLYDLGCGDGRICLEACAHIHCRSVGVEVEADLVERARRLVSTFCDQNDAEFDRCRPRIVHGDLRVVLERLVRQAQDQPNDVHGGAAANANAADAEMEGHLLTPSIIVLFLLPEAIAEVEGHLVSLLRLIPSLRIVCNSWGLPSLRPEKTVDVSESNGGTSTLYLYSAERLRSAHPSPLFNRDDK